MPADDTPIDSDVESTSESSMAEAAREVAANPGVQDALQSVVDLAMASCECFGASVTLVRTTGGAETTATSGELIEQADNLQYEFDEGPCLRAAEQGGAYLIVDTETDPRWPTWGPAVAAMGLHSVLSIHLFTDARVLGALNLYYKGIEEFADDEVETAKVVAAHASVALARLRSERDLWRAIDSRHLIGQAQGILMERYRLTPEKAFAVLRRHSQEHNIKLHEVAATLVRTGQLPDRPVTAN
ncbi:ANTAR domain-containing protein [Nakamurella sp.]|uniref:GAF and ANTAR domain-containing protein n=1 Tax=Nakamurella sp. TaxID=1869182 RepID=UPI003783C60A